MYTVDIHADDYGLSCSNADILIEAIRAGQLNSISIIPTMDDYDECMSRLREAWDSFDRKPLITVHIDLVDGRSQVDPDSFIETSWGNLFIKNYCFWSRAKNRHIIAGEIRAQIERVVDALPQLTTLRLDSHMHTHMIPIVADAMWEAYDAYRADRGNKALPVSFVRIAREPVKPFLAQKQLRKTYSPINFVKNMILNIYSGRLERQCRARSIEPTLLWGLIMSGHMDIERVSACYSAVCEYAKSKNRYLEILFHPAGIDQSELAPCHNKPDVYEFYLSPNRQIELNAVRNLVKYQ